jgi:hypothetical protein
MYCFKGYEKHDPVVKDHMSAFSSKIKDIIGKFYPSFILEEDTGDIDALPSFDDTDN